MEWLWSKLEGFFKVFSSYIVALARLVVWTIIFFFTGLQRTLFMRSEVVSVEFKVTPLRCDMEEADNNLAYIDKLCLENPDLVEAVEEEDLSFLNDEFPPNDEDDEGDI